MITMNNTQDRQIHSKAELIACLKEFNAVADKALTELDTIDMIMSGYAMKQAA